MSNTILVIDCNYLGYQALYTMGNLSSNDIPTGIIYGFLSRIASLSQEFDTDKFIFCWDSRFSKRKEMFSNYKSKRRSKDESREAKTKRMAAYRQFTKLRRRILPAIGFSNIFIQKGYEADDIIASVVSADYDNTYIIISADKDLFQLIQHNIMMYNPSKQVLMTQKRFIKEYGVSPHKWVTVKAIGGCKTDDVPGIPGIGESSAIKYIRGDLPKKSKKYKDIRKNSDNILRINVPLVKLPLKGCSKRFSRPDFSTEELSVKAFRKICSKYDMQSLMRGEHWDNWRRLLKGNNNE